jgi:CRP-like cAMP-binding protein
VKKSEAERLILRSGWLAERPAEVQAEVLVRCRLLQPQPGTFLRVSGDDPGGIYGVVSGGIGILLPVAAEGQILVSIVRRGSWIGYGQIGKSSSWPMTYLAMEPSVILYLPMPLLRELQAGKPGLVPHLHALTDHGLERAAANVTVLLIRNSARRIAATLIRVAPLRDETHDGMSHITATQAQIGEMANAARDVVNRALKDFERKGWIRAAYGRVTILDPARLRGFSEGL